MRRKVIAVSHPVLAGNEKKYVLECLESSWISAGRYVNLFEASFAGFCSSRYAVSCCNGTAALHLALASMGTGPGDEVIAPTLSFVATANAVRHCGAEPVFADSEPRTMNIDPRQIVERITPKTKGIVVVHLYGHPADMDPILEIARQRNLFVIEDAAAAHGATYKGRMTGSLGDAAAFSFFGNKIITTGEGGMVTTNDPAALERMRLLRGHGMDPQRRYWAEIVGFNYKMTDIQAAVGMAQMEQIEMQLARRKQIAQLYSQVLSPYQQFFTLPICEAWATHAFWGYSVLLNDDFPMSRDELISTLAMDGIETRPVFYPIHTMPPYRKPGEVHPIAERLSATGISLPIHPLLTDEDVSFICAQLVQFCSSEAYVG